MKLKKFVLSVMVVFLFAVSYTLTHNKGTTILLFLLCVSIIVCINLYKKEE